MKTTLELPDQLLISAKKRAAERRKPLKALVEQGLRWVLSAKEATRSKKKTIRWVTIPGGLPESLALSSREKMTDLLKRSS